MSLVLITVLVTLLALRGAGTQSVTQPDSHITVSEGARLEPRCNDSSPYPNQGLQLLLKYISGDSLVSGIKDFKAECKSETTFHLEKPLARWRDSAKYFCLWVTQHRRELYAEQTFGLCGR
ncbi:hypothetical protein FD755_013676 [Muntiacus reevesi]|uniref:Immunoglobulin V-set domain-containing protein n=1 Tax=Muntiacus reevesi TaxID=9886 RepID=A0A5N3XM46_MUNRE|nr:hypothetical protein FD755_013676 [Muntiacus reevesi]